MKGTFFRFSYLSVWKRTIKKSSYIKKHCSSLGILCQLIMHTSWLSEQSKNILNICFIEIKTYISLKALWVQETKSLKRTSDVPWSENLLFFFLSGIIIMMISHDEALTARLKRRRAVTVLEIWRGFGLKWISTPALHMAVQWDLRLKRLSSPSPLWPGSSLMASWYLRRPKKKKY